MTTRTRRLFTELLELVLPTLCAGCGSPGPAWCSRCASGAGPPRMVRVVSGSEAMPPTVAVGRYAGPLRAALLAYKERGRRELATPLAELLGAVLLGSPLAVVALGGAPPTARPYWLVPAPSRASAVRGRGGDHMLALVRPVAERMAAAGCSVGVSAALRMRRGGRDSVGLDAAARSANLSGRVAVRAGELPPRGATVLLVDDVVTSGATLRNCASALAAAGVPVGGALVLCDATGTSDAVGTLGRTTDPVRQRSNTCVIGPVLPGHSRNGGVRTADP